MEIKEYIEARLKLVNLILDEVNDAEAFEKLVVESEVLKSLLRVSLSDLLYERGCKNHGR